MNARVLELIKNPELFQNQDLELLSSEIKKQPYIQNIRALQLYGIHKFRPEDYQNSLSTTAAYTTDKKILYQFINRNTVENIPSVEQPEIIKKTEETKNVFTEEDTVRIEQPKPVYVNGALNRILFEGEEDFLERKSDVIDLESTMESGQIVIQSKENDAKILSNIEENKISESVETVDPIENRILEDPQSEEKIEETEKISQAIHEQLSEEKEIQIPEPEINIEEEITENNDAVGNPAEISFHGTEEFLSEVKIAPTIAPSSNYEVPKPQLNKHEIEMQRLIAEVEAKMKSRTATKTEVHEQEKPNTDLDFSETQNFDIVKPEDVPIQETPENAVETIQEKYTVPAENREWKPMSFAGNTPDALIGKTEVKTEKKAEPVEPVTLNTDPAPVDIVEEKTEERPVFNVSFFTQNVSAIESEKVEHKIEEKLPEPEESNVPAFINTWQKWLKIERTAADVEEKPTVSKAEVKNTVIENFIVKEPRISKLKEESDFVVKEKGDNISHLMTETLAKLYVEQKLYSKAIKAYHILSEKHPEKKSHFSEQINYIKELRQNK